MVMGDICTRACKFCNVKTFFRGQPLDREEPAKLARTVREWGLDYVVITSVDRDDLPDGGAGHFSECIRTVKKENPGILVEVLIPDFGADPGCLKTIVESKPSVIAHNLETVKRLQGAVRDPPAGYSQSLSVLETVKRLDPSICTKSSLMLGVGEKDREVLEAMHDLRERGVDFLTLGQYLRPSLRHLPVREFVPPEKWDFFRMMGEDMGFLYVASGPLVRSSYRAGEFFLRNAARRY
jgi:lipoic acid synthetase